MSIMTMFRVDRTISVVIFLSIFSGYFNFINAGGGHAEDEAVENDHSNETASEHEKHLVEHHPPYVILFLFGCCLVGAIIRLGLQHVPLPYTVVLLVLGFLLGISSGYSQTVADYTHAAAHMDPHVLLNVFLPILLFESAFAMDVHTFMKSIIQVCILAIFGFMVATTLTAVLSMYVFQYGWNFKVGMMFGSIMSATDPVAVVALLKDLGASKQLGTMIEGESLLNDGCSIVVFDVFHKMSSPHYDSTAGDICLQFLQVAIGGSLWGILWGKVTTFCLSHVFNDALVEITITLGMTYCVFYVGEWVCGVSGVLAVVMLGLIVNAEKVSISPEVEVFLHRFWEMLAYLANTLIFMIVGVVIAERAMENVESMDWFNLLALYMGINIIRAIAIGIFSPILARIGYGLTWRNAVVMTWGGLRGAVGLALALLVAQSGTLDSTLIGSKVLFHTSGIVLLTLIVNATTIQVLLKQLGMTDISAPKRLAMSNAVRQIREAQTRTFTMLKADRFLADADFTIAEAACRIMDPYKTPKEQVQELAEADKGNEPHQEARVTMCPKCNIGVVNQPSPEEFHEMMEEARQRMLKAEKTSYWKQFEHGMLSRDATRVLMNSSEQAADEALGLINIDNLSKSWTVKGFYPFLKSKLQDLASSKKTTKIPEPHNKFQLFLYRLSLHMAFELFIMFVIVINMIPIIMAFRIQEDDSLYPKVQPFFFYSNFIFTGLFVLEAIIKILGLRKHYFFSHWNQFDMFIILISLVDIALDATLGNTGGFNPQVFKLVKPFRMLRSLRMLRLFKIIIPKLIDFVDGRINKQLSLGYDVGKGFVLGEEEINKVIDRLVDDPKILTELKKYSEKSRLEIIRQLGMLQRDHPGIAVSVKTRQAIRTVLNISRDTIIELKGAGLLDEGEVHKLEKEVEVRMKRLMNAPSSIPPPPPDALLRNVAWLAGDKKLINYIKSKAELLHYDYQQEIMREGEKADGIYLIVSGLVRLHGQSEFLDHEVEAAGPQTFSKVKKTFFEDYLTAGNVIGEMSLLTGKPRNCTATCETAIQTYFITVDDMNEAMRIFTLQPTLETLLWRVVSIRIATPLLMTEPQYQGWTQSSMKIHLETGFVVELNETGYDFEVSTDIIEDLVLIKGIAFNYHTRAEYTSPCVIPRTVHRLILEPEENLEPKLFVVPTKQGRMVEKTSSITSVGMKPSQVIHQGSTLCMKHSTVSKIVTSELDGRRVQSLTGLVIPAKSLGPLSSASNPKMLLEEVEETRMPRVDC